MRGVETREAGGKRREELSRSPRASRVSKHRPPFSVGPIQETPASFKRRVKAAF